MTSTLAKSKQIIGAHFQSRYSTIFLFLMFLNIQIDLIILKTYDQQFTLTTKKLLHIIFKFNIVEDNAMNAMYMAYTVLFDNGNENEAVRKMGTKSGYGNGIGTGMKSGEWEGMEIITLFPHTSTPELILSCSTNSLENGCHPLVLALQRHYLTDNTNHSKQTSRIKLPNIHYTQSGIQQVQALADISRSALCCHSNETPAPIANPPNSAQLGGTPYHFPKLHPGL